MDVPFQGKVHWGEELDLGKHLPVPLVPLSPALFPQAVGANKGTKFPQAPATESLGGGQDAPRNPQIPTSASLHMQFPVLFLSSFPILSHLLGLTTPPGSLPRLLGPALNSQF